MMLCFYWETFRFQCQEPNLEGADPNQNQVSTRTQGTGIDEVVHLQTQAEDQE